jgi:hypothetical protein
LIREPSPRSGRGEALVIIGEAKLALIMRAGWNFEREVP